MRSDDQGVQNIGQGDDADHVLLVISDHQPVHLGVHDLLQHLRRDSGEGKVRSGQVRSAQSSPASARSSEQGKVRSGQVRSGQKCTIFSSICAETANRVRSDQVRSG